MEAARFRFHETREGQQARPSRLAPSRATVWSGGGPQEHLVAIHSAMASETGQGKIKKEHKSRVSEKARLSSVQLVRERLIMMNLFQAASGPLTK